MRKIFSFLMVIVTMITITSCQLCTVDGGEEGVFIKQPWFFG